VSRDRERERRAFGAWFGATSRRGLTPAGCLRERRWREAERVEDDDVPAEMVAAVLRGLGEAS
jgi:hypothetical protein